MPADESIGQELLTKLSKSKRSYDLEKIKEAIDFEIKAHDTQMRASGDPYYTHPIEVAGILADYNLDNDSIITALLHDTVEDTEVTLEDITHLFGESVSKLVDGTTKLAQIKFRSDNSKQAENFRKLLVAISEDIRVLIVKLADRLHNMRTLHHLPKPEKRMRIAKETMEIYAPLAERIGMRQIQDELCDISFQELQPEAHQSIASRLEYLRETGTVEVDSIRNTLATLMEAHNIDSLVTGREKRPFSIWRKMQTRNMTFEQLADIVAFRIKVDSVEECYRALGLIHSTYPMVPDNFKDYISTPKPNGYQSLHTVVIGPNQSRVEIQIRTKEMHQVAELGVAAHWAYKQSYDYSTDGKQYQWIRELLHILEQSDEPEEFLEHSKLAMHHNQVFCFTPKGDLIALPAGATPVDFAFAVHSEVGRTTVGAKVNGKIVPLRSELYNGDQVEIIRSKSQEPSPVWENFVVTGKARSEIRRYIRSKQRDEYISLGKEILSKALLPIGEKVSDKKIKKKLSELNKDSVDDVYEAVGEGLLPKKDVLNTVYPDKMEELRDKQDRKSTSLLDRFRNIAKKEDGQDKSQSSIAINGLIPGMAIHFAGCCHPLPGEKIVGIVNTGKGVTIHNAHCAELHQYADEPERWLDVSWQNSGTNDNMYVGRLRALLSHEKGSLGTLANVIASHEGNINNLRIESRAKDFFEIILDVEVRDVDHLNTIIGVLRAKLNIRDVERFGG